MAKFRNYDMNDGLPGEEFYYTACTKDHNGNLYFGCNAGLLVFNPSDLKDNLFIPPVVITGFGVFNEAISADDASGILKKPVGETSEIHLSHRQNDFSFSFAALNYRHPEKNRFAYKLEGYDKDWIYTGADNRIANYTNIGAGTFQFKVRASNNDGIWNNRAVSIKLVISPPYWQTWWFRLLAIVSTISIVYGIYKYRIAEVMRLQNIRTGYLLTYMMISAQH